MTTAAELPLSTRIRLLSGADVWHTHSDESAGVPAVMLTDGPHGLRKQEESGDHLGISGSNPATCFPTAAALGSSWDPELVHEVGAAVGAEARAEHIGVVLGPGLNIKRHPNCGRNFEYLSEDPLVSGRLAAAIVRGIQSQGVGACLKHFAVNNQEAHRLVVDVVVDERTLREIYLTGFEIAVQESAPWTVMAAYNQVNGTFCTDHHRLLTTILRDEWGFTGLVMSDWGATNDRVSGVLAGMDLEMPGSGGVNDPVLAAAVTDGLLDLDDVTTCAQRVLDLAGRAPTHAGPPADLDAHHELARRTAAECTVLLANDGVLPLREPASVALIGAFAQNPRYQGAGSSLVNPTRIDTAWESLVTRLGLDRVSYHEGYDPVTSEPNTTLIERAADAARAAEVAICMVGLPAAFESEGFDRTHMRLPDQHIRLIEAVCAANPRTVVVLSNGSPVEMPWAELPAAIVESYLGGQASGSGLVDVLLGDRDPGGRLAETFPVRQSDVAADAWFPGLPRQVQYREGLYIGYRYFSTAGVPVRFPFGHGLSYTRFAYSPAALDTATVGPDDTLAVSLDLTNTGARTGSEVVQVYVRQVAPVVHRPEQELRDFAKVRLDPGQAQRLTFTLPRRAFAHYDARSAAWVVAPGEYDILIGASSADIRTRARVTVESPDDVVADPAPEGLVSDEADFAARLGRPIPDPLPPRPFSRLTTVGELADSRLGSAVRWAVRRVVGPQLDDLSRGDAAMRAELGRTLDETPLRSLVLFADGRISWGALDGLIDALNGDHTSAATAAASGMAHAITSAPAAMARLVRRD